MKRTMITADLHLSDQPVNAYRLDFVEKQLPKLMKYRDAGILVIAGDLTDQKDRHSAWLTHHVVDLLSLLAEIAEVFVIEGNHDFLDIEYPFFRFLEQLDSVRRIHWISKPTLINDGVLLLPHTSEHKQDWKNLPRSRLIVTHNTFDGSLSEHGGKMRGIPLSALPKVPIISGDVHQPQTLGRLSYVGPPYTVRFGDDFEPRVLLVNENAGIVSFPTNSPRKRLVDLEYPWKKSAFDRIQRGDIVKLRIAITQQEASQWPQIRADAQSLASSKDCHIFAVQPLMRNIRRYRPTTTGSSNSKSDAKLIREYCSRRNADPATTKTGLTIASEP